MVCNLVQNKFHYEALRTNARDRLRGGGVRKDESYFGKTVRNSSIHSENSNAKLRITNYKLKRTNDKDEKRSKIVERLTKNEIQE
ncbi:hypothetical protein TNCV_3431441 [Trichonephila clavipes]|nr:hypothetical protein TNCV_3431441 [Trichonephila clavipes]